MRIILEDEGALVDAGQLQRRFYRDPDDEIRAIWVANATAEGNPGVIIAVKDERSGQLFAIEMTARIFFGIAAAFKGRAEFEGRDLEDIGFIWKDR